MVVEHGLGGTSYGASVLDFIMVGVHLKLNHFITSLLDCFITLVFLVTCLLCFVTSMT
jgi:hypothetical protein